MRIASIASMFYTSKRLADPPSSRFWTLIPDGSVCPEMPLVPSATGLAWLDGKNKPVLDKGDSLDPGDNVADPLPDGRVLSVQRNSAVDRHRKFRNAVSELLQSPLGWMAGIRPAYLPVVLQFLSEHALHSSVHHSRFVPLGAPFHIRATQWATPYGS